MCGHTAGYSFMIDGGTARDALHPLLQRVDLLRLDAGRRLDNERRLQFGQFLTPSATASFMASMFEMSGPSIRLVDAGAGIGSLTAAFVAEACRRPVNRRTIEIAATAYEVDPQLVMYLREALDLCAATCCEAGIRFTSEVVQDNFIETGTAMLSGSMFAAPRRSFNAAILNPPYRKIHSESKERRWLRSIGVETGNLYTAFLAIVTGLIEPDGELVTITPRSFANGPYFRPFRLGFLDAMRLRRIHVFEQRDHAFRDDQVLQENVIIHAIRRNHNDATNPELRRGPVIVSSSDDSDDPVMTLHEVEYEQIVNPEDADAFIHIVADDMGQRIVERLRHFTATLADLGLTVSTGRVVDFRAEAYLRDKPSDDTAPLIYPIHLRHGRVAWPKPGNRKPNALVLVPETESLLVPAGHYVLVKRFSAKEERRRVVATLYDPALLPAPRVAFENHLNYYHQHGGGVPADVARGLTAFLNSTLVDTYFRQFNGHTQVNATDLRRLPYPSLTQLTTLGALVADSVLSQVDLDRMIEREFLHMAETPDPVQVKRRVEEAIAVLKALGLPRAQQNERTALALLALLRLGPEQSWSDASAALCGITQMMSFMAEHYGKRYAPNTRETVRRQSIHQFVDAGLVFVNPDDPRRPINSGKFVYQLVPDVLALIRAFGTDEWDRGLPAYLSSAGTLARRYAQERKMHRIPVQIAPGKEIALSPGGQNVLIEQIIHQFCPRFTPDGKMIYIGDTDDKWAYLDAGLLAALGVTFDPHGKMPDVIVYHETKGWLVLIEAVTSHGPVDPKRQAELRALFAGSSAELVFVKAFLDRQAMVSYLDKIAWETEVWVADAPSHLIHFNGERFLGPY